MSKADSLFEKLGYKKVSEDNQTIVYKYDKYLKGITFIKKLKVVSYKSYIDMQKLQAINEKCKELGWV